MTATLLNMQNPMHRVAVAWWPGGRTAQKPTVPSPASSRRTSSRPDPAASMATSNEDGPTRVSASMAPPPAAQNRSSASTSSGRVDRLHRGARRRLGADLGDRVAEPRCRDAGIDGAQALRPLGMPGARVVVEEPRVGDHQQRHCP